ncbi:hypothetical protein STCU_10231 [Strigomonas culicis]|uniref:Uncharacterized protein n=1 Tax=Strigomonas culicis TaxID=28005 RepID=S9TMP0_9TRYP|nr:hypothetical protein STCU_10231 [Strigomonas culicis]|eukprot:EPY18034.1 hypothetical protein STCU_10231 [Strigomonas culicis]
MILQCKDYLFLNYYDIYVCIYVVFSYLVPLYTKHDVDTAVYRSAPNILFHFFFSPIHFVSTKSHLKTVLRAYIYSLHRTRTPLPMFSLPHFSQRGSDDSASVVPSLTSSQKTAVRHAKGSAPAVCASLPSLRERLKGFQFCPEEGARTPPCSAKALPCDSPSATWDSGLSCDGDNSSSGVCVMSALFNEQESKRPGSITLLKPVLTLAEVNSMVTPPGDGWSISARSSILTNNHLCDGNAHSSAHGEAEGRRALLSPVELPAVPLLNAKEPQDVAATDEESSGSEAFFYYTDVLLAAKRSRAATARHASAPHAWTRPVKVLSPRRHSDKPFCPLLSPQRRRQVSFTEDTEFIHACKASKDHRNAH